MHHRFREREEHVFRILSKINFAFFSKNIIISTKKGNNKKEENIYFVLTLFRVKKIKNINLNFLLCFVSLSFTQQGKFVIMYFRDLKKKMKFQKLI